MNRAHAPRRPAARLLLLAGLALVVWSAASPVAAAEGGLQLLPELPSKALAEALGAPYGFALIQLLVVFTLLIWPVNRFICQPLLRVLDAREERIGGTRAAAERLQRDAAEVLASYEASVRETREESEQARRSQLETVRGEAQRETAAARRDAEGRIEQARGEVGVALESARSGLRAQAEELARQAASQVLGRAL